jgi:hypothetical protein
LKKKWLLLLKNLNFFLNLRKKNLKLIILFKLYKFYFLSDIRNKIELEEERKKFNKSLYKKPDKAFRIKIKLIYKLSPQLKAI